MLEDILDINVRENAVADPGFPVGGACTYWGGVGLQHGHFSVKMYAKTKELGPIGGGVRPARPPPLDPPMKWYCQKILKHLPCCLKLWPTFSHLKQHNFINGTQSM